MATIAGTWQIDDPMRWNDLVQFVLSWAFRRRPKVEQHDLKQLAASSQQDHLRRKQLRRCIAQVLNIKSIEDLEL